MNKELFEQMENTLRESLLQAFPEQSAHSDAWIQTGKTVLTDVLKNYVAKHGSKELENIMLGHSGFEGSGLQTAMVNRLSSALQSSHGLQPALAGEVASFAANSMVQGLCLAFNRSGNSKDLDGICAFIGIDKHILAMVNSPMGKLFGKFF